MERIGEKKQCVCEVGVRGRQQGSLPPTVRMPAEENLGLYAQLRAQHFNCAAQARLVAFMVATRRAVGPQLPKWKVAAEDS